MNTRIAPVYAVLLVFSVFLSGCATGGPLKSGDLSTLGWENTDRLQCYLSKKLTLEKLPEPLGKTDVSFSDRGDAQIRTTADARGTIVLPVSLMGLITNYSKRDLTLYVAFEDGGAFLPFVQNADGEFSLMFTTDEDYQNGKPFVEYEGERYRPRYSGGVPRLNVIISKERVQPNSTRRQIQGNSIQNSTPQ